MKRLTKSIWKKILWLLIILFALIQFIPRPKKNLSALTSTTSIGKLYTVPDSVLHILKVACYDCHSNNTYYPWYNSIQPVALFLNDHVANGKKELNFDEFGNYTKRRQKSKLKSIASQVKDNEMPLTSYKLLHGDADLSKEEKQLLFDWANKIKQSLN